MDSQLTQHQQYLTPELLQHVYTAASLPAPGEGGAMVNTHRQLASPEAFAPRAVLASDAPAACSDMSDGQLLALTDTASLTADQLDRRHHLLRHSLPDGARGESVLVHFEASSVHEAVKLIKKMSQRDLQAKFKLVYGAKTFSNNNNWLRRKLFEAIGVDPAKGAVKKAAAGGGGGGRRRRGTAARGGTARAARTAAPRAARTSAWTTRSSLYGQGAVEYQFDVQYGQQYEVQYEDDMEVLDEEDGHVCEALLALGAAAASLEESYSEGSVPSISTGTAEPTPATAATAAEEVALASTVAGSGDVEEGQAGAGGSAAFRRLLLEHQEHQHATAGAAGTAHPPLQHAAAAGMAEYLSLLQQHAAAAAAAAAANGADAAEQRAAAHMHAAAAAASMHPVMAASIGLLPPPAAAQMLVNGWANHCNAGPPYSLHPAVLPLFHQPVQQGVLGTLRHIFAAQQAMHAPAASSQLFAVAK